MNDEYGPEWEEHCDSAEHYLHNALRAALGGNWAEAIPLAKQAEYEAAQLVHALEAEMRK